MFKIRRREEKVNSLAIQNDLALLRMIALNISAKQQEEMSRISGQITSVQRQVQALSAQVNASSSPASPPQDVAVLQMVNAALAEQLLLVTRDRDALRAEVGVITAKLNATPAAVANDPAPLPQPAAQA